MISWLRRAASKRSCVTSIHAMPCRSIFPPAWRPKYRANRGPNRRTARPARQGRSRTAAGAKMLPVPPCRRTPGRIFVQIARSQPDFRRQRDDFAFIGFVHKNSDILHRGQVFQQAVFLKQKTRFAESIAYRARFRRFKPAIKRKTVVLPQPLGPNKAFTSPCCRFKLKSCTMGSRRISKRTFSRQSITFSTA